MAPPAPSLGPRLAFFPTPPERDTIIPTNVLLGSTLLSAGLDLARAHDLGDVAGDLLFNQPITSPCRTLDIGTYIFLARPSPPKTLTT